MSLKEIPFGTLKEFNVLVEISEGSNLKYEYNPAADELKLDFVFKDLVFPFNYGFIPHTIGGDNDPLDVAVLSSDPLKRGDVVKCKVVGMVKTIDRGQVDNKLVGVPLNDPLAHKYQDIPDLPPDFLKKFTDFYMEVARQKKKVMEVQSLENRETALAEIKKALIH